MHSTLSITTHKILPVDYYFIRRTAAQCYFILVLHALTFLSSDERRHITLYLSETDGSHAVLQSQSSSRTYLCSDSHLFEPVSKDGEPSVCHPTSSHCNTMSSAGEPVKVAILDDYQRVAFTFADWSALQGRIKADVFTETLADEDALVERLKPYPIICAMRERTKFPASLLDRLPNLKLIATTGMRNAGIDVVHAKEKSIVVSGTGSGGNSTLEHIWALILATARHVTLEDTGIKAKRQLWQTTIPVGLASKTLGLVGVGGLGSATAKVSGFPLRQRGEC